MKIGNKKIKYREENSVDFCRKKRTFVGNHLVSSHRLYFSPEDQTVEAGGKDYNPSVNKNTWMLSDNYENCVNGFSYMLNKGMSTKRSKHNISKSISIEDLLDEDEFLY